MKLTKTLIVLIFAILSMYSCENNTPNICDVENPLEELTFLKEAKNTIDRIDCAGKSTIVQYTYNSQIVFLVDICNQIADGQTFVYNCSGEVVCEFGGIAGINTCPDFNKNATNKIILLEN